MGKIINNPFPNGASILVLPISKLAAIDVGVTSDFISNILKEIPQLGKEHKRYFILNNHLTLHNQQYPRIVAVLNVLLQRSRLDYTMVQITKGLDDLK